MIQPTKGTAKRNILAFATKQFKKTPGIFTEWKSLHQAEPEKAHALMERIALLKSGEKKLSALLARPYLERNTREICRWALKKSVSREKAVELLERILKNTETNFNKGEITNVLKNLRLSCEKIGNLTANITNTINTANAII